MPSKAAGICGPASHPLAFVALRHTRWHLWPCVTPECAEPAGAAKTSVDEWIASCSKPVNAAACHLCRPALCRNMHIRSISRFQCISTVIASTFGAVGYVALYLRKS